MRHPGPIFTELIVLNEKFLGGRMDDVARTFAQQRNDCRPDEMLELRMRKPSQAINPATRYEWHIDVSAEIMRERNNPHTVRALIEGVNDVSVPAGGCESRVVGNHAVGRER